MKKIFCLFVLLSLLLLGCSQNKPQEEGIDINSVNVPVLSFSEAWDFIEQGKSGVLFLSFQDCPYCKASLPTFEDMAKDYPNVEAYYVNIERGERVEGNEVYDKFFSGSLKATLMAQGYDKIPMPTTIAVLDGQIVGGMTGINDIGEEASEERIEYLKKMFEKVGE